MHYSNHRENAPTKPALCKGGGTTFGGGRIVVSKALSFSKPWQ